MENQEQQQFQQQNQEKKGKKSILLLVLLLLLVTVTVGYAVLSTSFNIRGSSKIIGGEWEVGPIPPECKDDPESCDTPPIDCRGETCDITYCDTNLEECCDQATGECPGPAKPDCTKDPDKSDPTKCECNDAGTVCTQVPQIWLIGDTIYFRHELVKPGDVFTFDATYKNSGNIDAKLESYTKSSLNATAQQFMTYDVKYSDGSAIVAEEALNAGASKTYRVTVTYKNVETLPTQTQLDLINEVADGHDGATSSFTANYVQK